MRTSNGRVALKVIVKLALLLVVLLGVATFQDKLVEPGNLLPWATQLWKLGQRCVTGMIKAVVF